MDVTNTGTSSGDEVVQLYVRRQQAGSDEAVQELRGFQRVHLAPGERRTVTFSLEAPRDLRRYDEAGGAYAVPPGAYEARVGASSADIRARAGFSVEAVHGKH